MNIIVTGGRHSEDRRAVQAWLDQLLHMNGMQRDAFVVVQGGASGVDRFAREWCSRRGVGFKNYPYPKNMGRAGGPYRNRQMALNENPAFVVAFPGGKGTRSMRKIANELGIVVINAGLKEPIEKNELYINLADALKMNTSKEKLA